MPPKSDAPVATGPWTKPADGEWPAQWTDPDTKKPLDRLEEMTGALVAEAVLRARFGFTLRGDRAVKGDALDAAWAEVERIKAMDADAYGASRYANLDRDLACLGTLSGLWPIVATVNPFWSPKRHAQAYPAETIEKFLVRALRLDEGPQAE